MVQDLQYSSPNLTYADAKLQALNDICRQRMLYTYPKNKVSFLCLNVEPLIELQRFHQPFVFF